MNMIRLQETTPTLSPVPRDRFAGVNLDKLEGRSLVAILGEEGDQKGFRLLGSGVLLRSPHRGAAQVVLTAAHTVAREVDPVRLRVFSQVGGIATIRGPKGSRDQDGWRWSPPEPPVGERDDTRNWISRDLLLLRLQSPMEGVPGVELAADLETGDRFLGYGGFTRGLAEMQGVGVTRLGPLFRLGRRPDLDQETALQRTDSGGPLVADREVAGVFYGRFVPQNGEGTDFRLDDPMPGSLPAEAVAVPVARYRNEILERVETFSSGGADDASLEAHVRVPEARVLPVSGEQEYALTLEREARYLSICVNGAVLDNGTDQEAAIRLFLQIDGPARSDGHKVDEFRSYDSQFQAAWIRDAPRGSYRLRLTAARNPAVFQLTVSALVGKASA